MGTSRRKMMLGLGALTVSGSAIFGSGALTQTEAQRGLQVEVHTEAGIAERFADVLLQSEPYSSAGFNASEDEATNLFPEQNDYEDVDGFSSSGEEVSILNEDVTIEFGSLLGSARNAYNDLFRIVNLDDGEDSRAFDVSFHVDADEVDIEINDGNDIENVGVDTTEQIDVSISPESGVDEITEGTLIIEISASQ
ncbi:hypothetical protein [Natranaeroarchaeum sulfidigenes]|nr:hypothetical protein [Natranaeroarchaeum sulfidigenes]